MFIGGKFFHLFKQAFVQSSRELKIPILLLSTTPNRALVKHMMQKEETFETKTQWIFFLRLSAKLSRQYIDLSQRFKQNGQTLIPVDVSNLLSVNSKEDRINVIVMIDGFKEAQYYHKKIRNILKYWMKSKRFNIFLASSFGLLDDSKIFGLTGNYHYYQLPIHIDEFCDNISSSIQDIASKRRKWPGTSRRLGSTIR